MQISFLNKDVKYILTDLSRVSDQLKYLLLIVFNNVGRLSDVMVQVTPENYRVTCVSLHMHIFAKPDSQ